jgi:hypothetical protein
MVDAHGKVYQIRCKVYIKIEGKETLLALKLYDLWKHNGRRKVLIIIPRVCKTNEYYMNKDFVHAKKEHLYCSVRKDTIANEIYHVVVGERKKNFV